MNQKAFHESSKHFTTSLQNLNFHKKKNFALSSSVFQYIFTILQVYLSKRKFHNHRVYIEKVKCLFYMPTAVYIVLLQYVDVWRHWEGKWKRKRKKSHSIETFGIKWFRGELYNVIGWRSFLCFQIEGSNDM